MRRSVFIYCALYRDVICHNKMLRAKGKIMYSSGSLDLYKNSHGDHHKLVGQDRVDWKGSASGSAGTGADELRN